MTWPSHLSLLPAWTSDATELCPVRCVNQNLRAVGVSGPAPRNGRHLGLTCRSPLRRRLAVMAGWAPSRCQTCARCVVGTAARAACRTALSQLEEPEVGARAPQPPEALQPRALAQPGASSGPRPLPSTLPASPRGSEFGEEAAAGVVACQ